MHYERTEQFIGLLPKSFPSWPAGPPTRVGGMVNLPLAIPFRHLVMARRRLPFFVLIRIFEPIGQCRSFSVPLSWAVFSIRRAGVLCF